MPNNEHNQQPLLIYSLTQPHKNRAVPNTILYYSAE